MQFNINWLCKDLPWPNVGVTTTAKIKQIMYRKFRFEKYDDILCPIPLCISFISESKTKEEIL